MSWYLDLNHDSVFNCFLLVDNILEECKSNNDSSAKDGASGAGSGSVAVQDVPTSGQIITPNLKMFSYAKLKLATRNFRPDTVLGEGGFGRVFKGWVDPKTYAPSKVGIGMAIAVKKSDNPDSAQGLRQWQVINGLPLLAC